MFNLQENLGGFEHEVQAPALPARALGAVRGAHRLRPQAAGAGVLVRPLLGQEDTEPELSGFKGFGLGFRCLPETWAGWAGDQQAAGGRGARWHGAASRASLVCSRPLEPAGCLQGRKEEHFLALPLPPRFLPPGQPFSGDRLRWERRGGSGRRLSRPSWRDGCEQGSGFPAPVTPARPGRCSAPPARVTSASPWPSAGDRRWRRVGAALQLGAWQLFRGIRGKTAPGSLASGRRRRKWLQPFAGPSPHTRFVPGKEVPRAVRGLSTKQSPSPSTAWHRGHHVLGTARGRRPAQQEGLCVPAACLLPAPRDGRCAGPGSVPVCRRLVNSARHQKRQPGPGRSRCWQGSRCPAGTGLLLLPAPLLGDLAGLGAAGAGRGCAWGKEQGPGGFAGRARRGG